MSAAIADWLVLISHQDIRRTQKLPFICATRITQMCSMSAVSLELKTDDLDIYSNDQSITTQFGPTV